jgi:hypothetical protein
VAGLSGIVAGQNGPERAPNGHRMAEHLLLGDITLLIESTFLAPRFGHQFL